MKAQSCPLQPFYLIIAVYAASGFDNGASEDQQGGVECWHPTGSES